MPVNPDFSATSVKHRTSSKRLSGLLVALILAGFLVACAEDGGPEEDRRFANDPVTRVATEEESRPPGTHKPDGEIVDAPTATSPGAGDALVTAEGGVATHAFIEDGNIRIVQNQGAITTNLVETLDGERIVDLSTSRDGERIAALIRVETDDQSQMLARVYDRFGDVVSEADLSTWGSMSGTPEPIRAHNLSIEGSITWAFDGTHMLATVGGLTLVDIGVDGSTREILVTSRAGTLIDAAWSPDGEQIALHAINTGGTATVWVFTPSIDGDSFHQVVPPPADAANLGSVTSVEWQPNGKGVMYILAATPDEPGGQLFTLDLETHERRVIATPGRGGPAAEIMQFTQSPDGSAVSYVIEAMVDEEWQFHSLWIRSTVTSAFFEVPTPFANGIDGTWWLGNGFAWLSDEDSGRKLSFKTQGQDPINVPLQSADQATPVASPAVGATPAASPSSSPIPETDATPVATPGGATPVASPQASPEAG